MIDPKGIAHYSSLDNPRDRIIYRVFEMLPATLVWGTLISCVVFSFVSPIWVAVFIILFDLHWLLKVAYLSTHQISSYFHMKKNLKVNWLEKCQAFKGDMNWQDILHLIVLPTYQEGLEVLETTCKAIVDSDYPLNKMIIVIGVEERDQENGLSNANILKQRFGHLFSAFLITVHPANIIGELAGKGSNETWAGRAMQKWFDLKKIPYENVVASVFDADTCVHPKYFSALTYNYLASPDRTHASYQPIPFFNNNFWDAPALMRVASASTTFWHMMEQERPERMGTFSSHAMSFKTVVEIGFWQTNIVSEDSRIFYQCFFHYYGNYRVVPLYMPVSMDTVMGRNFWEGVKNQYKQRRRWGWGVENLPYVFFHSYKIPQIPFAKKMRVMYREFEGKYSWAVTAIILIAVGWLPIFLGGDSFRETVLARNLPYITRFLMTISMIGMFVSAIISTLLVPPRPKEQPRRKYLYMILQWLLLPIFTIFFGSVPAIDAQTRLAFGKYMGFLVTPKPRFSRAGNLRDAKAHSKVLFKEI